MTDKPLWPHQQVSLDLYSNEPRVFDMSDAGTGKTRAAIEAYQQHANKRALIIAPKTLLDSAWGMDIEEFAPELSYRIAYAKNRVAAFSKPADIYITNTDAAKWLAKQNKQFFDSFDTLIIDESSYFKHYKSQRSKAMGKIAKHFDRRALLTATPTSRSITDIWHQALILDDGARLGRSFYQFRNEVCTPVLRGGFTDWQDKPEASGAVADILHDISLRHKFHEVMPDVPGNTEHYVYYTPEPKLLAAYNKLRDESLIMLEEGEVDAANAAVLRGKLLQVASGSVYGTHGKRLKVDNQRIELVADLVYERAHSIVFYNWDHQREQLIVELNKRKIQWVEITRNTKDKDRGKIVREFQAGFYQTLLMHPQTGAHGLTLTRGTATIWCSPTDRADLLVQGKHRVLRGGQTKETENIMVCAKQTLDKSVYDRTATKRNAMDELMELLR